MNLRRTFRSPSLPVASLTALAAVAFPGVARAEWVWQHIEAEVDEVYDFTGTCPSTFAVGTAHEAWVGWDTDAVPSYALSTIAGYSDASYFKYVVPADPWSLGATEYPLVNYNVYDNYQGDTEGVWFGADLDGDGNNDVGYNFYTSDKTVISGVATPSAALDLSDFAAQHDWNITDNASGCVAMGTVTVLEDGDGDADGSIGYEDCDDTDSSVRPGVLDRPGDGIDQDCDGTDGGYDWLELAFDATCLGAELTLDYWWASGLTADSTSTDGSGNVTSTWASVGADAWAIEGSGARTEPSTVAVSAELVDYADPSSPDKLTFTGMYEDLSFDVVALLGVEADASLGLSQDLGGATWTGNSDPCFISPATVEGSHDADADGAGFSTDCDDADATRYPGATDIAGDGIDQDCDGLDAITGFSVSTDPTTGAITATSTTVTGVSVIFPAGTTFSGSSPITVTQGGGRTAVQVTGATLPSGGTKSIGYVVTPVYSVPYSGTDRITYQSSTWVHACVDDSASAVELSTTSYVGCDGEGMRQITWQHQYNRMSGKDVDPTHFFSWSMFGGMGDYAYSVEHASLLDMSAGSDRAQILSRQETAATDGTGASVTWYPVTSLALTFGGLTHSTLIVFDDSDLDGLPDADEELEYGTDPALADSDGDGVSDGAEVSAGTDPGDGTDAPEADADGDGLDLNTEATLGTDPNNADSDGDGVSDALELEDGTNPLDAESVSLQDGDGDGIDDRTDNCPELANADQADADADGVGDACAGGDDDDDDDEDEDEDEDGCGCASGGPLSSVGMVGALLGMAALRRRRR